jgi:chromate reductase
MAQVLNVGVLVGSLRKASFTRKLANALIAAAPPDLQCKVVEIGELQVYNEDLEAERPPAWVRFRDEIAARQAFLFVTPEYNRSIPGGLKNAIDVGSRPQGQNVWRHKPAAVASITPYKLGAFGANHAVRQALVFLDVPVMQQPEVYLGDAAALFDESGTLRNEETRQFLAKFMQSFARWTQALRTDESGKSGF